MPGAGAVIKEIQTEFKVPANRGGSRPGAGRKAGSESRATREQKGTLGELARKHTAVALATLARVAKKSESDSASVAAANALLDRGYGKPRQAMELTGKDGGPIQTLDLSKLTDAQLAAIEPALEAIFGSASDDGGSESGEG